MRNGTLSALFLGVGLAGFWDGISLHSLLQWHHMISSKVPPVDMTSMRTNMVADGIFDFACWLVVLAGIVLLVREARRAPIISGKSYAGWILLGAGGFNLVEGIIDHEFLGIHHVHSGPHWLAADMIFLAVGGVIPMGIGWMLEHGEREAAAEDEERLRAA